MAMVTRKCKYCGKEFQTRKEYPREYCSNVCRVTVQIEQEERCKKKKWTKICVTCGEKFAPKNKQQQACSRKCAILFRAKQMDEQDAKKFEAAEKRNAKQAKESAIKVLARLPERTKEALIAEVLRQYGQKTEPETAERSAEETPGKESNSEKSDDEPAPQSVTAPGAVSEWRILERICPGCGKPFRPGTANQKWCTKECRTKALSVFAMDSKKVNPNPPAPKQPECPYCGKPFTPKKANQAYCCPECREADRNERRQTGGTAYWKKERTCEVCGASFVPNVPHQKTCCRKCSLELNERNSAAWKKKETAPAESQPNEAVVPAEEGKTKYPGKGNRKDGLKYSRQCHDCGKPTNDYRCYSCQLKWRSKHGVPESPSDITVYDFGANQ